MLLPQQLLSQAAKCRALAAGLTNRDDIRTLEQLAVELEERARAAGQSSPSRPEVTH